MKELETKVYDVQIGQLNSTGDNSAMRGLTLIAHSVTELCDRLTPLLKKGEYVESCTMTRRLDRV